MRIWLDALSPKQLFLFTSIAQRLRTSGHDVWITSRRYVQLDGLIESIFKDWDIIQVGEWGGGGLEGKLRASINRMNLLLEKVLSAKPDLCFSSGSPEASRICYGLRIPHYIISDTPHSPVNRLSAPLSRKIFTPWVIPRREWVEAGARKESISYYKALDPCFWLRDFKPDRGILDQLNVEEGEYILFRMPETQASYLREADEPFLRFVDKLAEEFAGKIIVSCRYREQSEFARKVLRKSNIQILDKLFPGASITYYSILFIGGGGTMTQEAALLGVPTISIYPKKLPTVLGFLKKKKLIQHSTNPIELAEVARKMLAKIDEVKKVWKRRAEKLWKIMEDPMRVIMRELETLTEPSSQGL